MEYVVDGVVIVELVVFLLVVLDFFELLELFFDVVLVLRVELDFLVVEATFVSTLTMLELVGFFELELVVEALKVTVTTFVVVESFTSVVVLVAVTCEASSERCGKREAEIPHLRSNSGSSVGYRSHFLCRDTSDTQDCRLGGCDFRSCD